MHNEFTAVVDRDGKWFVAYCPEIPGANGQAPTQAGLRPCLVTPKYPTDWPPRSAENLAVPEPK
jgi:hypothetical protein